MADVPLVSAVSLSNLSVVGDGGAILHLKIAGLATLVTTLKISKFGCHVAAHLMGSSPRAALPLITLLFSSTYAALPSCESETEANCLGEDADMSQESQCILCGEQILVPRLRQSLVVTVQTIKMQLGTSCVITGGCDIWRYHGGTTQTGFRGSVGVSGVASISNWPSSRSFNDKPTN